MNIKNNKLKTAVMASLMALTISSQAFAFDFSVYGLKEHDFNSNFSVYISGEGSTNNGDTRTNYYLYWIANDTTFKNNDAPETGGSVTLKGGNWYLYSHSEHDGSSWEEKDFTLLGPGGGMSEDELQQAIEDAVHNVDGDQTVTGDQQVDGEQTVNGGQSVSGGQTISGVTYFY